MSAIGRNMSTKGRNFKGGPGECEESRGMSPGKFFNLDSETPVPTLPGLEVVNQKGLLRHLNAH